MKRGLPDALEAYGVCLNRLRQEDIEIVRNWRNHPEVAQHMLSQDPIDSEQQAAWFSRVGRASDRRYYLVSFKGKPTAFASVTSCGGMPLVESDQLEAAIYLAPESRCRGTVLAFAPALVLNDACFGLLGCSSLVARVKQENEGALRFNAAMGYRVTRREDTLVYLALDPDSYRAATQHLRDMLNRGSHRRGRIAE